MTEFVSRMAAYVDLPPAAILEEPPAGVSIELQPVQDIAEQETPAEDLTASWRHLKHNWGEMRERIKVAKAELRAIGRLAMLDVDSAHSTIQTLKLDAEEPIDSAETFRLLTLKERIQCQASYIQREQWQRRRYRRKYIKNRALGYGAIAGLAVGLGILETKYLS
jgi:hypothetical protein